MLLAPMKPAAPPLPHLHHHVDAATALSLNSAIPSPVLMPPTKRPKLSLQTTSLSTSYGSSSSGTTGNKTENMSTVTPTTLNTFNNTFDLTLRPSPNSANASPSIIIQRTKSSASTPFRRKAPYDLNLPFGVRPILKNSDLFYESRRGSLTASASPRSTRKVFFPPAKRVAFVPIDEEIVTHTYIARHVDLSSSEDESISNSSRDREVASTGCCGQEDSTKAAAVVNDNDNDERGRREEDRGRGSVQRLPLSSHGNKRKKRRWEWTIDDLDKTEGEALIQAQKSSDQIQQGSQQPPLTSPTEAPSDVTGDGSSSPQPSGDGGVVDEEPVVDNIPFPSSTTPKDDPPNSPWMGVQQ